ncbi:hypothetical protein ARMSODRAFT_970701 [Armillaria solidipes]|uniref:Uncharacterized protein n=1 Tax=Armillaria solidipes TaxID=1076256 RepID=A0A2H3CCX9_9AGAR|nr:hypothetical protein ARMSODRAFT_970701 [Armillaria solidipes]
MYRCNVVLGKYEPDSTMVSVAVNGALYRLQAGENRKAGPRLEMSRPYTRIELTQSNQLTTEDQYNLKYVWKDSAQVRAAKTDWESALADSCKPPKFGMCAGVASFIGLPARCVNTASIKRDPPQYSSLILLYNTYNWQPSSFKARSASSAGGPCQTGFQRERRKEVDMMAYLTECQAQRAPWTCKTQEVEGEEPGVKNRIDIGAAKDEKTRLMICTPLEWDRIVGVVIRSGALAAVQGRNACKGRRKGRGRRSKDA